MNNELLEIIGPANEIFQNIDSALKEIILNNDFATPNEILDYLEEVFENYALQEKWQRHLDAPSYEYTLIVDDEDYNPEGLLVDSFYSYACLYNNHAGVTIDNILQFINYSLVVSPNLIFYAYQGLAEENNYDEFDDLDDFDEDYREFRF